MMKGKDKEAKLNQTDRSRWIDISIPLRDSMVRWPTDPPTVIKRFRDVDRGDPVTMSEISLISHAGTHIDAPLHFIRGGASIDVMPLDTAVGSARVIEIKDSVSIKPEELKPHRIRRGERILFKTQNSRKVYRTDEFVEDYVYLTPDAAVFLAEKRVRLIGFDYISIGSPKDEGTVIKTHQALLSHSVWIIEGLNLAAVEAGSYEMICLPVKLERGDAGLARAVVRRRS